MIRIVLAILLRLHHKPRGSRLGVIYVFGTGAGAMNNMDLDEDQKDYQHYVGWFDKRFDTSGYDNETSWNQNGIDW